MCERQGGAQEVAHAAEIMFIFFDGFNTHPLSGQQSLVARGITRRGHEFEVSMATTEQKPSSRSDHQS